MRERGERRETQGQESDREGQHGRSPYLRRERHPQTHRADELPPPLLTPRRRRRPPRHTGQDDHHQQVHGLHRQVSRIYSCHRQFAEDVRDDGPVREAIRQHGGSGRVYGEFHGWIDLAFDSGGRGQQFDAASGG